MSGRRLLTAVYGIEQGWAWLYTAGMPAERSERRREEIRSDAWDHAEWAFRSGQRQIKTLVDAAARFVLGVPSDLAWRVSWGREGVSREAAAEAGLATLIVVGLLVALPLAPAVLVNQYAHATAAESGTLPFSLYVVIVTLVFGGLGVLAMDRFPVAGGVLVLVACAGIGVAAWWIPLVSALCVLGGGATAYAMLRGYRGAR